MGKVYFLIGKNNLLIEEKIKEISKRKNLYLVFNKNSSEFFLNLQKNLNQRLIGEDRDLVIKNIEELKNNDLNKLVLIIAETKSNIFFICKSEPTELLSSLRKNKIKFELINVKIPQGKELRNFILELLKKKNLNFPPAIVEFLISNYSDNIDLLIQDLNKISALESSPSTKDFRFFFSLLPKNFKILDLFLDRNWPDFIHNFKKFISADKSHGNVETLKLLSLLSSSLVRIYLLKNNKKITGHYFYLEKLQQKANKLNFEEIKRLQTALAKTERKFKKFFLNPKEIPEDIYFNYLLSKA